MGERWRDEDERGIEFEGTGEDEEPSGEFRDRVERFERYSRDELEYSKIFTELGFTFIDDGCEGYCLDCPTSRTCEFYPELKKEWEKLERETGYEGLDSDDADEE